MHKAGTGPRTARQLRVRGDRAGREVRDEGPRRHPRTGHERQPAQVRAGAVLRQHPPAVAGGQDHHTGELCETGEMQFVLVNVQILLGKI